MKVKLHRNSNNTGFRITVTIKSYTFSAGIWRYGWDNPAYYKRFDHICFQCVIWKSGTKEGDFFYRARGLEKRISIREDGRYQFPRLLH